MIIFMLVSILILAVIGTVLIIKSNNLITQVFGEIICLAAAVAVVVALFMSYKYIAAGHKKDLLNKECHTNYTQEDIFYARDIVKKTLESKCIVASNKLWER